MAKFNIPTILQKKLGKESIELYGSTVDECLDSLHKLPEIGRWFLCKLHVFINETAASLGDLVRDSDTLSVIPEISGGTGGKGDTLRNAMLDYVLGGVSYTPLGTVYIALYTTSPTATTAGTEVSGSGTFYSRYTLTNNTSAWVTCATGNAGVYSVR